MKTVRAELCPEEKFSVFRAAKNVTVQTAGKQGQKQVSSVLVNMVLPLFTHRMDIRCFLSGLWPGKKIPAV